jgi:hypothetical protein
MSYELSFFDHAFLVFNREYAQVQQSRAAADPYGGKAIKPAD